MCGFCLGAISVIRLLPYPLLGALFLRLDDIFWIGLCIVGGACGRAKRRILTWANGGS